MVACTVSKQCNTTIIQTLVCCSLKLTGTSLCSPSHRSRCEHSRHRLGNPARGAHHAGRHLVGPPHPHGLLRHGAFRPGRSHHTERRHLAADAATGGVVDARLRSRAQVDRGAHSGGARGAGGRRRRARRTVLPVREQLQQSRAQRHLQRPLRTQVIISPIYI